MVYFIRLFAKVWVNKVRLTFWYPYMYLQFNLTSSVWNVSKYGVFSGPYFRHLDWIRRDTKYLSVSSLNAGQYGPEKIPYLDTFHAVINLFWVKFYIMFFGNIRSKDDWTPNFFVFVSLFPHNRFIILVNVIYRRFSSTFSQWYKVIERR